MPSGYATQSTVITVIGVIVALVAIVGTEFLGWEWGSGQLVPTLIGAAAAGVAVVLVARNVLS